MRTYRPAESNDAGTIRQSEELPLKATMTNIFALDTRSISRVTCMRHSVGPYSQDWHQRLNTDSPIPAPLGLSAFAATTFTLSLISTKAQGVTISNAIVGPAFFYGGIVRTVAGIWEIALENTFGGTALCSYEGFWMSFAAIYIPWFGVTNAYEGKETELGNVMGVFLLAMTIFTLGIAVCAMRSTLMFVFFLLFFLLGITFLLLAISEFTGKFGVKRSAGVLRIIVSLLAWYNASAGLATRQNSYLIGHPVPLPTNEYTLATIAHMVRLRGN